jgi:hypothetical protein
MLKDRTNQPLAGRPARGSTIQPIRGSPRKESEAKGETAFAGGFAQLEGKLKKFASSKPKGGKKQPVLAECPMGLSLSANPAMNQTKMSSKPSPDSASNWRSEA